MKKYTILAVSLLAATAAQAGLAGLWEFNTGAELTATVGNDLTLTGTSTLVGSDFQLGKGDHYTVAHGLAANGGGTRVNEYTLVWDVILPTVDAWNSLFSHDGRTGDGSLFIRSSNTVGAGALGGYSANTVALDGTYRIVLSMDVVNGNNIYVNGALWKDLGTGLLDNGARSLSAGGDVLWFEDNGDANDGDESDIIVSTLAIYDFAWDSTAATSFGSVGDDLQGSIIPEPGTYATLAGLAALTFVMVRRRKA